MPQSPFALTIRRTLVRLGYHIDQVMPMFDSRTGMWRTPGAKGRPDLIAVNPVLGYVIAAEVKGDTHRPSPDQLKWLQFWNAVPCCVALVLQPKHDMNDVVDWFREPWTAPSGFGWLEPECWDCKPRHAQPALPYYR